VSTIDLFKNIRSRIGKYKILILIAAAIGAIVLYIPEFNKKKIYTAKATVFPLNSDNEGSSSSLSGLLGLSDPTRSFGNDNAVNILELTVSRTLMQAVASKRLAAFNNETIAEALVTEKNNSSSFFSKKISFPSDSVSQVVTGGSMLSENFSAKINKNNVLELYFSNTNPALLEPITDTIISEITKFYTNLKIEKALADYNFTIARLDSVQIILDKLDSRAIGLQNTTLFTSDKLLAYQIPKNYISDSKDIAVREKDMLLNNKEEAMWRLQKLTPIVEILDKPEPPYESKGSSPLLMAIIGFILGGFVAALIAIADLIYVYAKTEIRKTLAEIN
jgi:uncharacterized protein involved in exopolysaccharide biosynthesis